jgi:two-component system phosphate regulon response regulator PhoB
MPKPCILVVDDEEDILELVRYNLAKEGYLVETVASGEDALNIVRRRKPDLVLLDLMLPGLDGLEVCKKLKADSATAPIPIVMLTAKGEDADIVSGLELGADDYITKPFSPRVLTARVRAALRRRRDKPFTDALVRTAEIAIDLGRHEVRVADAAIELTATEFNILHFLAARPGLVFTRGQIIDAVKGNDYPVTERSVDVQIVNLRRKLGESGDRIETVRGVGYRLRE